jgi:hypothetical protein
MSFVTTVYEQGPFYHEKSFEKYALDCTFQLFFSKRFPNLFLTHALSSLKP